MASCGLARHAEVVTVAISTLAPVMTVCVLRLEDMCRVSLCVEASEKSVTFRVGNANLQMSIILQIA